LEQQVIKHSLVLLSESDSNDPSSRQMDSAFNRPMRGMIFPFAGAPSSNPKRDVSRSFHAQAISRAIGCDLSTGFLNFRSSLRGQLGK
jgi:hypothetical protein